MSERFPRVEEVREERFGGPISLTTICLACGGDIRFNEGNWPVHVEASQCQRPTISVVELRA